MSKLFSTIFVFLFTIISSLHLSAAEQVIKYAKVNAKDEHRTEYFVSLLSLALSKAGVGGEFTLRPADKVMSLDRLFGSISGDSVDVVWSMTSPQREDKAQAIRVPLLKGILGYRIFLIREGEQPIFSQIKGLDELKLLKAGQGAAWVDANILRTNGLPVVAGSTYQGLFSMLKRHRFDYFPRGVHEPWQEMLTAKASGLAVEQTLLLHYKIPTFFFVAPGNQRLKHWLEKGLAIAIADGSFDELFFNHRITKQAFKFANIHQRRIFDLDNPFLTKKTQAILSNPSLWYKLGDELQHR